MQKDEQVLSKPRSEAANPEIIRLAKLTWWRIAYRNLLRWFSKILVLIWTRTRVVGLDNIPQIGPALIVANHLGDADFILGLAYSTSIVEPFAKIELYEIPVLGKILDAYGVIWVHRGQPDRRALRVVMEAMKQKRIVGIAPEGRESLTGALEEGTDGATYLALKSDVPIIPVTFTGTENRRVFNNMKRFKRTEVTVTIGKPFRLAWEDSLRQSIKLGTDTIMYTLARQLPEKYQGFYKVEN